MGTELWQIDTSHSGVHFTVRHMVIAKVHGRFARFEGKVWLDEQNLGASRVEVTIDAASIDTSEEKRDAHLRSADFLDAEKHPQLTFKSTAVEVKGADELRVAGDLAIHGVTRPVTLAVERLGKGKDPWGNQRVAFTGKLAIDRKDFGLKWNQALESGGVLVADRVDIELEVQALRAAG